MSYADDIRTIAKTALLEEKVGKALAQADSANALPNLSIPPERGTTTDTATSSNTQGSSNGPPADGLIAQSLYQSYDPSGGIGTIDQALWMIQQAAVSPINPNLLNQGSDTLTAAQVQAAVAKLTGGSSTDMTNSASNLANSTTGAATGGSNAIAFAQGAPNDTTLSGMVTAATTLGASANDIAQMKANYLNTTYGEPGMVTAKQIGDANVYNPSLSSLTSTLNYGGKPASLEQLKTVVGFDQNGTISPVTGKVLVGVVHLGRNTSPTPTLADSLNNGQGNPWTTPTTQPIFPNFQLGKFWTVTNPSSGIGATPGQAIDNGILHIKQTFPQAYPTGYASAHWDASTLVGVGSPPYTSYNFTWYQGPTNVSPNTVVVTRVDCPVNAGTYSAYFGYTGAGNCPSSAPSYSFWPKTGSFILNWVGAQVFSSVFDSEVPIQYSIATSTVRLAMGDGTNVVDTRFLDIQPAIYGGYILSTVASNGTTINSANYYDANGVLQQANLTATDVPYYLPR